MGRTPHLPAEGERSGAEFIDLGFADGAVPEARYSTGLTTYHERLVKGRFAGHHHSTTGRVKYTQEADALAASRFGIGHIAIGNALSYLDFRFGELSWRDGHERLAAWHAMFDARPSVVANPPVDDR